MVSISVLYNHLNIYIYSKLLTLATFMQAVCRQYAGSMQAVCRQYAGSMQAVCRQYAGSMQAVCRQSQMFFEFCHF
jgi:hypothetical protein